jgi:hypothetical protein
MRRFHVGTPKHVRARVLAEDAAALRRETAPPDADAPDCPACSAPDAPALGALGRLIHYRCRACGWTFHNG